MLLTFAFGSFEVLDFTGLFPARDAELEAAVSNIGRSRSRDDRDQTVENGAADVLGFLFSNQ